MPNRASGECGIQNGTWCLDGKNTMASPGNTYYALCADAIGEPYYLLATPPSHPQHLGPANVIGPTKGFLAFLKSRIEFTTGVEPPTHIWDQVPNSVIFVVVLIVLVAKLVTHSGGQVCNFCIYSERQL